MGDGLMPPDQCPLLVRRQSHRLPFPKPLGLGSVEPAQKSRVLPAHALTRLSEEEPPPVWRQVCRFRPIESRCLLRSGVSLEGREDLTASVPRGNEAFPTAGNIAEP